ncbi:sugar ABC transporter substrate-binding protein [Mycobacterium sp. ITM-2016-00317]|uniref:sugar ABC transporter substrate-binding protein n=1 Tax=Mycobacterium sp. ITM-2016-00317 TaxID=2099694 RepID=UPI00287F972D|nr:sugar ABC transporter substrate-binding protein [Mycobacterium sp. ITM-2016-00317]WNG87819.1 sugar ABC transporter substrate-binding protein [Mycobacterium sp. ITM-2016-00317]
MSMSSLSKAATLVATGALFVSLTACSQDTGAQGGATETVAADQPLRLAMNVYSRTLPYFQDMIRGVQDQAEEDGHTTVDVTYGETNPQQQYDQLENALSTSPNGMLIVPVDPGALLPVIQQASTSGVPVVTLANDIDAAGHQSQLAHAGQEYVEIGRRKAQYIVDALGGQGTVGYVHGIRGLTFSELQSKGAMEVFEANPGITVVDGPYAGEFSSDAGLTATENVLTANPNLDALYYDNDDIALGGIMAVQQRGRAMDDIVIIGTDGGEPALQAVESGTLDMTISLCGYATGRAGASALIANLRDGSKPENRFIEVAGLEITRDNLTDARAKMASGDC